MRSSLLLASLLVPVMLAAQQQIFFEDFEAPMPAFAPNAPDLGSVTSGDNTWLINNAYAGGSGTITCLGIPFSFTVHTGPIRRPPRGKGANGCNWANGPSEPTEFG